MGIAKEVDKKLGSEEEHPPLPAGEEEEEEERQEGQEGESVDEASPLPRSSALLHPRPRRHTSLETLSVLYNSLSSGRDTQTTIKHVQMATETFKMISEHCDVDQPLCSRCPEAVVKEYERQIQHQTNSRQLYEAMAERLEGEGQRYQEEAVALDGELEALRSQEAELRAQLLEVEGHRRGIARRLAEQRAREHDLKAEEQHYWSDFNAHQQRLLQLRDEQLSVCFLLQRSSEQLTQLKKSSVLNAAFHIWHNGHFGTINGLRLGRLQTVPVEWSEINGAWGQTAFLLSTLARLAGVQFERYKLVPYGNQSFIEATEERRSRILPLYSTPGLRLWTDLKFDAAMVAFLDCLSQLKTHIEQQSSSAHFSLPYRIERDQIGDGKEFYSIRTQFNTPEKWTKALKFVLTNLRWALAWQSTNAIQSSGDTISHALPS